MEEIWRDIIGYEGYYQISNLGRVKSLARKNRFTNNPEKLLKINTWHPYNNVYLCVNGVKKRKVIHRMVADAFIPNPENKPQVNHIDGVKKNNRVENLEWVSISENIVHSVKNGLHYHSHNLLSEEQICMILILSKHFKGSEIARKMGIRHNRVYQVINGQYNLKSRQL